MFGVEKVLPTSYTLNFKYMLEAAAEEPAADLPSVNSDVQVPSTLTFELLWVQKEVVIMSKHNVSTAVEVTAVFHVIHVDVSRLIRERLSFSIEMCRSWLEHDGICCERVCHSFPVDTEAEYPSG